MSVGMDVVGVMAAYLPVVLVCTALSRGALGLRPVLAINQLDPQILVL